MSLEDNILIENYLNDTLSKDDKKDFEERLDNDLEFKEKFLFEKQLFETLSEKEWSFGNHNPKKVSEYKALFESEESKELKSVLEKVGNDYQKSRKKRNSTKWMYSTAAMIALLVLVYSLFYKPISNQELYATYIKKTALPSLIERGESQKELLFAQQYFENKEYDKALKIFEIEIKNTNIQDAAIYLYTGISQMELNQFTKAEKTFDNLISSNLLDAPKGKWYKALLYLKKDDVSTAKQLLTEIVKTSSYNYKEAAALLKKLNNL